MATETNNENLPEKRKNQSKVIKHTSTPTDLTSSPFYSILQQLVKSANTGVKSEGEGLLMLLKAKELGIGFANSIPHMHVINGKPGIDIHIVKAILSKPSSYVTWKIKKYYEPVYQVITEDKALIATNEIPPGIKLKIVKLSELTSASKEDNELRAALVTTKDNTYRVLDWETEYEFTREKQDMSGNVITVTSIGYFSWSMAKLAGLNLNKAGLESTESAWYKYRPIMIATRAFTYGARDIASDLLKGNYESTELFEMENIEYDYEIVDDEILAKPKKE
jgi:hypothetical protein